MEYEIFTAKTVDDALAEAAERWQVRIDELDYDIEDKGSSGILGLGSRPATIRARLRDEAAVRTVPEAEEVSGIIEEEYSAEIISAPEDEEDPEEIVKTFLGDVFSAMKMDVVMEFWYDEEENVLNVDLQGDDMGILIGKRGQTLDSLQYLTSLVLNKNRDEYLRVKLDIENYRERRQDTLENLAHSIASKVKRTHHPVVLEPMNPYERRVIHSALQSDRYVVTRSEGEEPYRHIIVSLKRDGGRSGYGRRRRYDAYEEGQDGSFAAEDSWPENEGTEE